MKPATATFNKRLNKFDPDYFGKDYKPIVDEKQLTRTLATYLFDNSFELTKDGWKQIMDVRALFPEVWWDVLQASFEGNHDT